MSLQSNKTIVIVGGGPAGLSTALALRQLNFGVIVIECDNYSDTRMGEYLPSEAIPLLCRLEIVELLTKYQTCDSVISAWGQANLNTQSPVVNTYRKTHILSRPGFDNTLRKIAEQNGVKVLLSTQLISISQSSINWQLQIRTANNQLIKIKAGFIVDASGRNATIAKRLDRKLQSVDKLMGITAYLDTKRTSKQIPINKVLLEACKDGWWYSAIYQDGTAMATYMTDIDIIKSYDGSPIQFWRDRLICSKHTKLNLRACNRAEQVKLRIANSHCLDRSYGNGWLAVGDAAISLDPLVSSGIFKGMNEGVQAAEAIARYYARETGALERLDREFKCAFSSYLEKRRRLYMLEKRWPNSLFWQRRHHKVQFFSKRFENAVANIKPTALA